MQPNTGIKPWQWVVSIIVIIALILLGWYVWSGDSTTTPTNDAAMTDTSGASNPNAANRIVVGDQYPGNIVYVSSAQLANGGFVVIKKDAAGTPGAVIGSQWFDKGINPGRVNLSEATVDGKSYYAVLYADTDNNKKFDATKDMPLKDENGSVIMRTFRALSTLQQDKG